MARPVGLDDSPSALQAAGINDMTEITGIDARLEEDRTSRIVDSVRGPDLLDKERLEPQPLEAEQPRPERPGVSAGVWTGRDRARHNDARHDGRGLAVVWVAEASNMAGRHRLASSSSSA